MRVLALILFAAALGTAQVRIYVADGGDSRVAVIDPETDKVTGEIAVSPNPYGLAASPEGHWLYVTSTGRNALDVVDVKTSRRTRGMTTDRGPTDLAVAPDTRHVFVCAATSIEVIDTASLERFSSIIVGTKGSCDISVTPDETRMIVASPDDSMLRVINIRSLEPEFAIAAGTGIHALAIEGDRNRVMHRVFAAMQHEVEIIDYQSRKVTGRIPVAARDLAISPDWKTLWVTVGDSVEVYSLADLKRVATIPLGKVTSGIVFTPDGKHCFVANTEDNSVSSIDPATFKEIARVPVGKAPDRMVASQWMP